MNRKWISLLAAAVFLVMTVACGGGSAGTQGAGGSESGGGSVAAGGSPGPQPKKIVIAEPVHNFGYLPLYVAIKKGYFEPLQVEVTTLAGGGAHTNAVLTDQAWAFIGGPEHNAFAKAKGADLRAIINVVNRGNVYLVVRSDLTVEGPLLEWVKGKTIVTGFYGGTPNSITRYLLAEWGLDPKKDVVLKEVDTPAIASAMQQKQADLAVTSEPQLTQGIGEGIWGEPVYNVPKELGPYAYSTINVKLSTIQNDPETVQTFVEGMKKGLAFVRDNREEAFAIAKEEFPTMDENVLKAMMDRSYEDELWEFSGAITEESVETNLKVVKNAGMLDAEIKYEDIVDPQFIQ